MVSDRIKNSQAKMRSVAEYDWPLNFTVERQSKSVTMRCRTMPSPLLTLAAEIEPRHLEELAFVIFGNQISLGWGEFGCVIARTSGGYDAERRTTKVPFSLHDAPPS
jgi:hypothetical protein